MHCVQCDCEVPDAKIISHWRLFHEGQEDYNVSCPICFVVFSTRPSYQKHWYSQHFKKKEESETLEPPPKRLCSQNVPADPANVPHSSKHDGGSEEVPQDLSSISRSAPSFSEQAIDSAPGAEANESDEDSGSDRDSDDGIPLSEVLLSFLLSKSQSSVTVNPAASSFLLNLRDKCSVSEKDTLSMINETEVLVQSAIQEFSKQVSKTLVDQGIILDKIMNVDEAVQTSSNVFDNLKSIKTQNKHFEDKFNYVMPRKVPLGRGLKKARRKGVTGMKVVSIGHDLVFVPLKQVISRLVSHPDYQFLVEEEKKAAAGPFLNCYLKGEKWKQNTVLREHPNALRFVLYYDDLEACSPLKSKAGAHKIGAFYLYVDNIPIKYRSKLSSILLIALVNANHISGKEYGIDAGLENIKAALNEFENGVMLPCGKFVFGTLIAVIGDNKGLHALGGFKEGFTAHRPCRFCFATLQELRKMTEEDESLLRDIESYQQQCAQVQTARGKNEKLSTEFGINRDSILNTLDSFHVVGGLPPDAMHDLLEGALPLTIRKVLNHYLYRAEEKLFTLEWLNSAIDNFDYGYAEAPSKPSILKKEYLDQDDNSTKLHQSASQVWLLATILPMIIGPLVDDDDKHFENFLDILEICRIAFSVDIVPWMVSYLKDLIDKYLLTYISLYGDLIPKQHHMIHYPSIILSMGSLVPYQCMRMEAKHKYFKDLVNRLGSYKNIFWSLAVKHQLHQAVEWSKSLKHTNKCGPCKEVDRRNCVFEHLLPSSETKFVETSWLTFEGNKFVAGECFICIGYNEEIGPLFAKVKTIIIQPSIVFICQKVLTVRRNIKLASYEVNEVEELCTTNPTDMMYHSILHAHVIDGKLHIAFKYCAGGELL